MASFIFHTGVEPRPSISTTLLRFPFHLWPTNRQYSHSLRLHCNKLSILNQCMNLQTNPQIYFAIVLFESNEQGRAFLLTKMWLCLVLQEDIRHGYPEEPRRIPEQQWFGRYSGGRLRRWPSGSGRTCPGADIPVASNRPLHTTKARQIARGQLHGKLRFHHIHSPDHQTFNPPTNRVWMDVV